MKKTLLSVLCIGLLASTENTVQASLPARNTEKTELGQETNLTMADVKKTQAWKLLHDKFKKLIDEKRPEFGVFLKDYPDSGLMSIYKGDDWEIAISRDGSGCFVYPKKITKDMILNPLPEKENIINPKTNKPWIPFSPHYKKLSPTNQAYEKALLYALNDVMGTIMLDYRSEKDIKKLIKDKEIPGMVVFEPTSKSVSDTFETSNLTPEQIIAYDLFGKVVRTPIAENESIQASLNVYSACGRRSVSANGVNGDTLEIVTYRDKPFAEDVVFRKVREYDRRGKFKMIEKARDGLQTLLTENNLDEEKLSNPNMPLNERQASVSYIYQTAMPVFDNMLKLKDFQKKDENHWIIWDPSKNMMSYENEIFKNDTKVVLPKKIEKTNDAVKTHE